MTLEEEDYHYVGECLSADVMDSLVSTGFPVCHDHVCNRCIVGGKCDDTTGCDLTPWFIGQMRSAAKTLDQLSEIYAYGPVRWSADQIRYEIRHLEKGRAE